MTSRTHREEPPVFFNEQVLLEASDPCAILTSSASGHRRSSQGAVSSSSIRVCPTSPLWVQVYTTAFLVLQRSRVEHTNYVLKTRVFDGEFMSKERPVSKVAAIQLNFPVKLNALEELHCN
eukprot:scaffold391_cov412-Pavlova_lutheri.AAC.9